MQKNVTPGRRKGCPNYPPEFKQQLVAASCEPGISISKLALENGINANLLFKWRQQWREGKLLLPSSESRKRTARAVLTGMCYSAGSAMRHGSSSLTRLTGQSAMTPSTWRR
ncbi:transposase [Escherichia coli]|uniref:transposase n=1 Tax=Escherichia coli TaxID=562 RepID=UPI001CF5A6B1|nr:transposase [Escherichia coli]MCW3297694.1 transposase [Escherichia coli]MCW7175186.1 transposase [Escherichia coli]MCW7242243.1 transposase [Escherichia coli]MCW7291033.1 transposase [Escherichia coli]